MSPMEMLRPADQSQFVPFETSDDATSPHYLLDNFYSNGWSTNTKQQYFYSEGEYNQGIADSAPKLEDFFGGESSAMGRYSDSQTETQDSSLTHLYNHAYANYFTDHQDLKAIAEFQANSGSEVEDSASISRTHLARNELGFSSCPTGDLSLGVTQNKDIDKAIVSVSAATTTTTVADSDGTKKVADTFGQRTSIYRGVTRHRWTGRYEAHLWDNSCRREGQARKGRQVYLGGYDKEDKAARAYDLAALKYWGAAATTNFPASSYSKELEEMKNATRQEFIASLRRKSSGFSRGASMYRGVTRHHQQGRWQARIGRVAGNKDLYLGTFATEEEAAEAYDIAAIKFRGVNAVTNFEMNRYDVEAISNSALPIGGTAKRLKLALESEQKSSINNGQQFQSSINSSNISFASYQPVSSIPFDGNTVSHVYHHNLFQHLQSNMGETSTTAPMTMMQQPAEFYLWPHQPYNY